MLHAIPHLSLSLSPHHHFLSNKCIKLHKNSKNGKQKKNTDIQLQGHAPNIFAFMYIHFADAFL